MSGPLLHGRQPDVNVPVARLGPSHGTTARTPTMTRAAAFLTLAIATLAACSPAVAYDGALTARDVVVDGYMSMSVLVCACVVPFLALALPIESRLSWLGCVGVGAAGVSYGALALWYAWNVQPSLAGTLCVMGVGAVTTVVLALVTDRHLRPITWADDEVRSRTVVGTRTP